MYIGHETTAVPAVTSVGATTLVIAGLFAALWMLRSPLYACVGVLILISSGTFRYWGGAQIADIPLSLYVLCAFAILALANRMRDHPIQQWVQLASQANGAPRMYVLAGLMAGCGAMTKNEGLGLSLCLLIGMVVAGFVGRRGMNVSAAGEPDLEGNKTTGWRAPAGLFLLAGMAVPMLLVAVENSAQRRNLSPGQPRLTLGSSRRSRKPRSPPLDARPDFRDYLAFHMSEPLAGVRLPFPDTPEVLLLALLPLAAGLRRGSGDRLTLRTAGVALTLAFILYYVMFLIMPRSYDLLHQMDSFPRLQMHTWPALVFTICLLAGLPQRRDRMTMTGNT